MRCFFDSALHMSGQALSGRGAACQRVILRSQVACCAECETNRLSPSREKTSVPPDTSSMVGSPNASSEVMVVLVKSMPQTGCSYSHSAVVINVRRARLRRRLKTSPVRNHSSLRPLSGGNSAPLCDPANPLIPRGRKTHPCRVLRSGLGVNMFKDPTRSLVRTAIRCPSVVLLISVVVPLRQDISWGRW